MSRIDYSTRQNMEAVRRALRGATKHTAGDKRTGATRTQYIIAEGEFLHVLRLVEEMLDGESKAA